MTHLVPYIDCERKLQGWTLNFEITRSSGEWPVFTLPNVYHHSQLLTIKLYFSYSLLSQAAFGAFSVFCSFATLETS